MPRRRREAREVRIAVTLESSGAAAQVDKRVVVRRAMTLTWAYRACLQREGQETDGRVVVQSRPCHPLKMLQFSFTWACPTAEWVSNWAFFFQRVCARMRRPVPANSCSFLISANDPARNPLSRPGGTPPIAIVAVHLLSRLGAEENPSALRDWFLRW